MIPLVVAAVSVLLSVAVAQTPTEPAVLRDRLEGKLASPFLRHAGWHTSLDAAQQAAARSGKLIFAHFTRSFVPCGTSIRCEREVLSRPEFTEFARDVVLYCHVSAHLDPKKDQLLFATGGSGWPHHVFMDASGRVVGRHRGEKSAKSFRSLHQRARSFLELEAEAARRRAQDCRRQFEAGIAIGALKLGDARRLFAGMGTQTVAQLAKNTAALADLEVQTVVGQIDRFDAASHAAVGKHFYLMWRSGQVPTTRNGARDFWGGLLAYIESQKKPNLKLYEEGLKALDARFGEERGYQKFLAGKHKKLASLRLRQAKTL